MIMSEHESETRAEKNQEILDFTPSNVCLLCHDMHNCFLIMYNLCLSLVLCSFMYNLCVSLVLCSFLYFNVHMCECHMY